MAVDRFDDRAMMSLGWSTGIILWLMVTRSSYAGYGGYGDTGMIRWCDDRAMMSLERAFELASSEAIQSTIQVGPFRGHFDHDHSVDL